MNIGARRYVFFPGGDAMAQQPAPVPEEPSTIAQNFHEFGLRVRNVAVAAVFLAWSIVRMFVALGVVLVSLTPYLAMFGCTLVLTQVPYGYGGTLLELIPAWWRYWQCVAFTKSTFCFDDEVRPLVERIWQ